MSEQTESVKSTFSGGVDSLTDRYWDSSVGMGLLRRMTGADYISLVALFFAWVSALLLLRGEVNLGIIAMFGAFFFDKLDGYYARRRGISSSFGRQVDSFIDVFAYLVTAALIYHVALSPALWMSVLVGFVVLAFGGLRLCRHALEGFGESDGKSYYVGYTVVHTNFVVLFVYYLDMFVGQWNGWLAAVPIVVVSPLMVSGYKSYKTRLSHLLGGVVVLVAVGISLYVELGL